MRLPVAGRNVVARASAVLRQSRLLRYAAVGVLATASHWALLVCLVEVAAWPAWWATGAGAALGAQVAFVGNRCLTFGHTRAAASAWWRFQLTAAAGALLGMGVVALVVALRGHYLLAQALATVAVLLVGFKVNSIWSFMPPRRQ